MVNAVQWERRDHWWCHIFVIQLTNWLTAGTHASKQALCCLLCRDICIPLNNTRRSHLTIAFVFGADWGSLRVQLAFGGNGSSERRRPSLCVYPGWGRAYARTEEINTRAAGCSSQETLWGMEERGSILPKTARSQYTLAHISHPGVISAPTQPFQWPFTVKRGWKALKAFCRGMED